MIVDDEGRYFDGDRWALHEENALLFNEMRVADAAKLFIEHDRSPKLAFTGKVTVLVDDRDNFSIQTLREFLEENVRVFLQKRKLHPSSDRNVEVELDFSTLGT